MAFASVYNKLFFLTIHLASKTAGFRKKREYYRMPAEQVNWVGVSIWNQSFHRSEPFMDLLDGDYYELATHYKSKPFAIWKLGKKNKTLNAIKAILK